MALTDNLQAYYKLDESSGNASDSSGNGNTATNVNSTAYSSGKINNGASLVAASSNHFTIADAASVRVVNGWTVSFWIKPTSLVNGYVLNCRSGENGWGIGTDTSGHILVYSGSGAFGNTTSTATMSTGTWYHVVVDFEGTSTKLYINGSLDSTLSNANITNPNTTVYMGRKATSADTYQDGILDEVGIWSRALSGAEVTSLYNGGAGFQYPFTVAPRMTII